ncbi:OprD family porin [Metapseudomonas boanensis]|uniref:OprD family porin n=1 Tax=Metapseudomonas boanensis TaxID=2822138 RepID=UPI00203CDC09|nr:OprD family porin [Pseudomonas boanensis]
MRIAQKCLAGLACLSAIGRASADAFIGDSRTSLRYSQFYWKENNGDGVGPTRNEWVQAALFNFNSGWYRDVLGFDYSYGLADDLYVGSEANNISDLEADDSVQSPHGIAKPVEAYLRGRLAGEGGELQLGAGKKSRRYAQYFDDPISRILPPSTLGLDLDYTLGGLALRFSHINGLSARNESGWVMQCPGVAACRSNTPSRRTPSGWPRSNCSTVSNWPPGQYLDLYATQGMQEDAGDRFEYEGVRGLYEAESSHDARYLDLSAKYRTDHFHAGITYNKVRGDDFDRLFFSKDHGTWNSSAKLFYFFGLEEEEMFKLMGGMDFSFFGLPQPRLDTHYAFSDHAAGYDEFSRRSSKAYFSTTSRDI